MYPSPTVSGVRGVDPDAGGGVGPPFIGPHATSSRSSRTAGAAIRRRGVMRSAPLPDQTVLDHED